MPEENKKRETVIVLSDTVKTIIVTGLLSGVIAEITVTINAVITTKVQSVKIEELEKKVKKLEGKIETMQNERYSK